LAACQAVDFRKAEELPLNGWYGPALFGRALSESHTNQRLLWRNSGQTELSVASADEAIPDLAGTVLEGAYRLVRLIGRGGMGAVYEAVQLRLNKRVAVKLMSRESAADMVSLERFRREAKITSKLGHPHLVNLVDFGTAESGQPYLVMEYLEGEDLDQRLQATYRLPVDTAARIVMQAASALGAAHAQDVVHRDLKPANIFLLQVPGEPEFVKVLDFGISKVKAANGRRLTGVQSVVGTPAYMSPEQAMGRSDDTDHRADQWALACIAWEMLCGHPPFMADDTTALFFQIIRIEPTSLSKQVPDLPVAAEGVLRRALAKRYTDRYPSIREFARAFEIAALGRMSEATPAPVCIPRPTPTGGRTSGVVSLDGGITPDQSLEGRVAESRVPDQIDTALVPRFKRPGWRLLPAATVIMVLAIAGMLFFRSAGGTKAPASTPTLAPHPEVVALPVDVAAVPAQTARTETATANEPPPRAWQEKPARTRADKRPTNRMAAKAKHRPSNPNNKHRLFEEL
jgi:serine/threonine protein kinase